MVDPITTTLTVGAIVQLAFQTFLNSEAGKAAIGKASEVLTEKVLNQMGELRQKIWNRLRGKSATLQEIETSVSQNQPLTAEQMKTIEVYLNEEMKADPTFEAEVKGLAQQIIQEIKIQKMQGQNVTNVFGGEVEQFINENINAPIIQGGSGHSISITYNNPPQP